MAILSQVDAGALKLDLQVRVAKADLVPPSLHSPIRDQHPEGADLSVRELLRFNIVESDGTASDVLLRLAGGPERVTSYLRGLGADGVTVATSEAEMSRGQKVQYRNWATPRSMLELLRVFHRGAGLSPASRGLLLRLMQESVPGAQRIKGLLPQGTLVAHKTGTSGTVNGMTAATNDVGIVTLPNGRHMAVVVFVSDARARWRRAKASSHGLHTRDTQTGHGRPLHIRGDLNSEDARGALELAPEKIRHPQKEYAPFPVLLVDDAVLLIEIAERLRQLESVLGDMRRFARVDCILERRIDFRRRYQ
jgi:beta-lactamase class A